MVYSQTMLVFGVHSEARNKVHDTTALGLLEPTVYP